MYLQDESTLKFMAYQDQKKIWNPCRQITPKKKQEKYTGLHMPHFSWMVWLEWRCCQLGVLPLDLLLTINSCGVLAT